MPKNNIRRERPDETASRVIEELRYARIRHHVTYNSANSPRYIIIDIRQNQIR